MGWVRVAFEKSFLHFNYFYSHLGYRIFVSFGLSFFVALMDGLGLAMFIPLLQTVDGGDSNAKGLGGLSFLIEGMNSIGLDLSLLSILIVIVFFFIFKGIFKLLEGYYKTILQQNFIKKIRFHQMDLLADYQYGAFVLSDSGKIQNTISGEVNRLVFAYSGYFLSMQAGVMVLVYIGLAFSVNAQFTLLVILGGFLSNIVYTNIFNSTKKHSKKISEVGHQFQGLLIQKVGFFKYLKATASIHTYKDRLKAKIVKLEISHKKIGFNNALIDAIREPIIVIIVVVVILIEVILLKGSISLIILSLLFFYRALTYVISLQGHWNNFMSNYGALENIQEFVNDLQSKQEHHKGQEFQKLTKEIRFDEVSFGYNENIILKNISLTIEKNKTFAFVGKSGSGKSTVMNLLSGIISPDSGKILVDGLPMDRYDMLSYRKKIGYITQEPVIFDDSIYNNVTFWSEQNEVNKNKFWHALNQASIGTFVRGLPYQEHTRLGTNGILVSGGQKQRISIARELFKNVEIMLMDEATSSLDSETENIIQGNIENLKGKYTLVIVAHRLATIKNADTIMVINDGEIIASDDFNGLISSSSAFKKIVALQEF